MTPSPIVVVHSVGTIDICADMGTDMGTDIEERERERERERGLNKRSEQETRETLETLLC